MILELILIKIYLNMFVIYLYSKKQIPISMRTKLYYANITQCIFEKVILIKLATQCESRTCNK